jgi:hypothetical protein
MAENGQLLGSDLDVYHLLSCKILLYMRQKQRLSKEDVMNNNNLEKFEQLLARISRQLLASCFSFLVFNHHACRFTLPFRHAFIFAMLSL